MSAGPPRGDGVRLSVVAIVRNEEKNLPAFLASHDFADEIVLVDAQSDDRTRDIASAHSKVVLLTRPWTGFPEQWNFGIDHARGRWILISEADQVVSPALRAEVARVVADGAGGRAYLIPRRNYIFGRWLRHGGCWPDYCYPRLFQRGDGRFDESKRIHEKLRVTAPVSRLSGHFDHHSIGSVHQYVAKMNHYTDVEARMYAERYGAASDRLRAIRAALADRSIGAAERLSRLRPLLPAGALLVFLWRYFARLGFLDGRAGLLFCLMSSFSEVVWRAKVREIRGVTP